MRSHEIFRDLFQRVSPKELADALGLSVSMIYKWAEPAGDFGSGTPNPLERIAALLKVTGDVRIAEWVCLRAGGFYVKSPEPQGSPEARTVVAATNQIVQDFAEMLSRDRDRRGGQRDHHRGIARYPPSMGEVEIRHGNVCALLRARKF